MSTTPYMTAPRTRLTIPAMTSTTAMSQRMKSMHPVCPRVVAANPGPSARQIAFDREHRRGLRTVDAEQHRLLEEEADAGLVAVAVAEREVLAHDELEVATPQADDERAVERGCVVHGTTLEHESEVLEHRIAVLGALDDLGVRARSQHESVRALDAGPLQHGDRTSGRGRNGRGATGGRDRLVGRLGRDAVDRGRFHALVDEPVLDDRHAACRLDGGREVDRGGAAVDGVELVPRDLELPAQLDQRLRLADGHADALARHLVRRRRPSEVERRHRVAVRSGEVHEPAAREERPERTPDLVLDLLPCLAR